MPARVTNPLPTFLDQRGTLLDGGRVYVGQAGADPRAAPLAAYSNSTYTDAVAQPVRTLGGYMVEAGNPISVFVQADDYSLLCLDRNGAQVLYLPSVGAAQGTGGAAYQPLDADLTAIAGLATTAYGRGLLQLADQQALRSATGIPDPLPRSGGAVTGPVTRQGAGALPFWHDPRVTSGRIWALPVGTADPTAGPGDLVLYY